MLVSGLAATAASAARLEVTVRPTTVHRNETYTITISGRYSKRGLRTTPHLLAFIQYSGAPCQRTAPAEFALPMHEWNWLFYPQRPQRRSPFTHRFYETARIRFGERRVCAYLYAMSVGPQTTAAPLARAGAEFREVKTS